MSIPYERTIHGSKGQTTWLKDGIAAWEKGFK
jgi:hypothetical protein